MYRKEKNNIVFWSSTVDTDNRTRNAPPALEGWRAYFVTPRDSKDFLRAVRAIVPRFIKVAWDQVHPEKGGIRNPSIMQPTPVVRVSLLPPSKRPTSPRRIARGKNPFRARGSGYYSGGGYWLEPLINGPLVFSLQFRGCDSFEPLIGCPRLFNRETRRRSTGSSSNIPGIHLRSFRE